MILEQLAIRRDNYAYLLHDQATGVTAAVDPADPPVVLAALARRGWRLSHILNTHHHADHAGGNEELKAATGARIIGAAADAHRLPGLDQGVGEGDLLRLGGLHLRVLEVPGHTLGHIAFWDEADGVLFCGDTLFSLGCGRLFEGSPAQMWHSLTRLRALPSDTLVCCAHEYTQSNGAFARTVEPDNPALLRRLDEVEALRAQGRPTVPSRLADEAAANPFLRADRPETARAQGLPSGTDPVEVFAQLRRRKDVF